MSLTKAVMMLPGGSGETLTITCFTCGMPSSKEWAQKIRSRGGQNPNKPYYPFLLQIHPPSGSSLRDDGTTFVCAFCHASLESQWKTYERQQPNGVPPMNRKYNLYKYICAVCGVETYRKRVRTLPFQEFPFLTNQRPAGSLTLGNNPLAIVCLDCSETLWAQSAEYDRWGLPVHKRQFNWMARPPPPEDSVEATVARLPSGETQLPRCPPIEPVLSARTKEVSSTLEPTNKPKTRSSKSETLEQEVVVVPLRKCSSSSNGSIPGDILATNAHPPVVTVAPMAAHGGAVKKDGTIPVRGYSPPFKYDGGATNGLHPPGLMYPVFPRYLSPYGSYPSWGPRDSVSERFPYTSLDSIQAASGWPWANVPSSAMLQFAGQMPTYPNRNYSNEQMYHPSHFVHFSSQMPNMQTNLNGGVKINPGSVSPASPLDKHSPDTTLNGVAFTEVNVDENIKSRRNSNGKIYNGHHGKRNSRSSLFEDENHVISVNSTDGDDMGLTSDSGNEPPKFNSKQYTRPVAAEIQNPSVSSGKSAKGNSIPDDNPLPVIPEKPLVEDRLTRKRKVSQDAQVPRNDSKQTPSKKFMIDYLCKSDDQQQEPSSRASTRNVSSRQSVIVSSPAQKPKMNASHDRVERNNNEKCVVSSHVDVQKSARRKSFADVRSANKDVNETAVNDPVPEDNIEEYAKKLVEDYKKSLRIESARKKKALEEQEKFLSNVGLVTHAKKTDAELNRLVKQAENHTLPPLKLRPSSPQDRDQVGPKSEKELISKLFDDPSLKQHSVNEEEASFLANVDLKPATAEEKQKRERVWRYILLDRMKRNRQQSQRLKTQKPWKSTEDLSKAVPSVPVKPSKTVSLRQSLKETKASAQPSELQLRNNSKSSKEVPVVPRRQCSRRSSKDESPADKPVISYPTYTPRLPPKSPTKQTSPERSTVENGKKHIPVVPKAITGQPVQNGTHKVESESLNKIEELSTDFENLTERLNSLVSEVLDVATVKPRGKAGKRITVRQQTDIEKWKRIKLFLSSQQKQFRLLEDKMSKKEKLMAGLLKSNSKHAD